MNKKFHIGKKIQLKGKIHLGQTIKTQWKKILFVAVVLTVAFFMGRGIGVQQERIMGASTSSQKSSDWGLGFGTEGSQPTANGTPDEMKQYDAYYVGNKDDKVIYLTFDCGYENGNTPAILEALKKHNAPATFFVVGNFLNDNPDLIKQMVADGHTIGNHTMHHRDVSTMGQAEFEKEVKDVEEKFKKIIGQDMIKYYRAPQGKYSLSNLKIAKDMGYKTIFWSLAYLDWDQNKQPTKEEAFDKLLKRIHPGAVVLLHNTSKTNGTIMDELLTKWEEMGYHFEPVSKLWGETVTQPDQENNTQEEQSSQPEENQNQQEQSEQEQSDPAVDTNTNTDTQKETQSEAKPGSQSETQSEAKPGSQSGTQSGTKQNTQPSTKPEKQTGNITG